MTVLIKNQTKQFLSTTKEGYQIKAIVRFDDQCGNGHNTFSITGEINDLKSRRSDKCIMAGCIHDEIKRYFPELKPFIKWHLTSTDGPMHYISNSLYWIKEGNLDYARSAAVWPEATIEEFTKEKLEERLPGLLEAFKAAVESLGFTY